MPENASAKMSYDDKNLYATLSGEIDHHTAKVIRRELDEQMCRFRPMICVLNLKQVSFMDSAGIGLVVGRVRLAEEWHGVVHLAQVPAHLLKIFALAGLERLSGLKIEAI